MKNSITMALEWIKANSTINRKGLGVSTLEIPYVASIELLVNQTLQDSDLPERTNRRIVNLAIRRWRRYKKYQSNDDVYAAFLQALEIERRKIENNIRMFRVVMFINLDETTLVGMKNIRILGDQLKILPWKNLVNLKNESEWKKLWFLDPKNPIFLKTETNNPLPRYSSFTPIEIVVKTYDTGAALSEASDRFDLFRAIINLSSLIGNFVYMRSQPTHLSKILPTPIYLIYENEKLLQVFRTAEKYRYKKAKLKNAQKKNIDYFLPFFIPPTDPSSSLQHIIGILRLYQDSLDSDIVRIAYLSMWQVVESSVTFKNENIKQDKVVSRIITLTDPEPLYKKILVQLMHVRNRLVHSGDFLDLSDRLFFLLKLFGDTCIYALFKLSQEYKTSAELQEYFRLFSAPDTELKRKASVITKIQKTRGS